MFPIPIAQSARLCVYKRESKKRDWRRRQRLDVEVLGSILKAVENNLKFVMRE